MAGIGAIGFTAPWVLAALVALPVLWWLLRAVPPAPVRRLFPAVILLIGLRDEETTPVRTPWWLLVLRLAALAAVIVGLAGPVLDPRPADPGHGPLLVLADAGWASAPDWGRRQERIAAILERAATAGRPAALVSLTEPGVAGAPLPFRPARRLLAGPAVVEPRPWEPDPAAFAARLATENPPDRFDTVWLSDGLDRDGRTELVQALMAQGSVTVFAGAASPLALAPPRFTEGGIGVEVRRAGAFGASGPRTLHVEAHGTGPAGNARRLAVAEVVLGAGETTGTARFSLPSELANRIRHFSIAGLRSAGAVALADDTIRRRKVALFAGAPAREGQELVSPLHFLKKALAPSAEIIEATLADALRARPDVIAIADVATFSGDDEAALGAWLRAGGRLVRFAGPRLAARDPRQLEADPFLPVRLRSGGRSLGGAMSWGAPRKLRPFDEGSPFFGLAIPGDVTVTKQVIAEPGPELERRTIAALEDGTPLVTRKAVGKGEIILFHVSANAEWSTLPLSGLFVSMLERLAVSAGGGAADRRDLAGRRWQPERVMNAHGDLLEGNLLPAVSGRRLAAGIVAADMPPGLYRNGGQRVALNIIGAERTLTPARWPAGVAVARLDEGRERSLKGVVLAVGLGLLLADILAALAVSGRLWRVGRAGVAMVVLVASGLMGATPEARADGDGRALAATRDTVLAYVRTGDGRVDAVSRAGLAGLSRVLAARTAVEPADPIAVDPERDELAFFPLIYWPMTEAQKPLSDAAAARLNAYLAAGGLILFDTRDGNLGGTGASTAEGRVLRRIASRLAIPALEPIPRDHVLTRSFYLLTRFPGRYSGATVWVEAAPDDAESSGDMPFRHLNDGVSPVIFGGNDWAAAWAVSAAGVRMFPVGRGDRAGELQREYAFRFGVNLVMYVLTGNYKSDQVHVPALLERLGQ